jgi:hypothetical protein
MIGIFRRRCQRKAPADSPPNCLQFHVSPEVKASVHPDGVVLIHLGRGTVFSANRVGAMIWNGAAERWSLEQVAASISGEFDIPPATVRQDAAKFLAQLAAEGLLIPDVG